MMMEVSGGSIDALGDGNLTDILIWLDAVSVLRCRAVCKRWRRVATDRPFLAAHAAARPREMIVETIHGFVSSSVPLFPTDMTTIAGEDDGHHRFLLEQRPLAADGNGMSADFELYASLDGLLVLKQWRYDPPNISSPFTYVICNPVTRQWANLPLPAPRRGAVDVVACGFYLHASSGEYRLLLHCVVRARHGDWESYCCVVSVGSALPRRLAHAPPSESEKEKLIPYYEDPVSCRGALHWLSGHPEGSSTGKMLAFDMASETFRLMSRPPVATPPEPMAAMSDLLELDGELSVATVYGATLDIWALQDYEAEKWTLRHRLKVQPPPRSLGDDRKRRPIIIMGNGSSAILVGFPPARAVMAYSLNDNKVGEINFGGLVSFKVFSESLVPHDFFHSPETVPLNFSNPLLNERIGSAA